MYMYMYSEFNDILDVCKKKTILLYTGYTVISTACTTCLVIILQSVGCHKPTSIHPRAPNIQRRQKNIPTAGQMKNHTNQKCLETKLVGMD